jgi:cell wall-associated NlpC family hydrolase
LVVGIAAVAIIAPGVAAHAEPSIEQIEAQIQKESTRLEKVVEDYNRIGEELKASLKAAQALKKKLAPLQAKVDAATARIAVMAAEAYKGRSLAEASAVLSSADPSIVMDRLVTLGQISQYENANMASAEMAKAMYDVTAARLEVLIADQKKKRQTLQDQKKSINSDLAKLYALRTKIYGNTTPGDSGAGTPPPYVEGKAGKAVNYAYAALGKPYEWAAAGPDSYDCSGLTMAAWRAAGVYLPHNAAMQWEALKHISRGSLMPGDLVFYSNLGHVAIFVGGGQVIHSPTFGDVVRLASVDMMTPYGYARPG